MLDGLAGVDRREGSHTVLCIHHGTLPTRLHTVNGGMTQPGAERKVFVDAQPARLAERNDYVPE